MSVKSPKERVYYYECSYGKFRLTYFIPRNELESLFKDGKIAEKALEDFPDGVDLRVGETDYMDFKKSYDYRPEIDPEMAKDVFYSIFSTTKNWEQFRGSDIILAEDLEERIKNIDREMKVKKKQSLSDFAKTSREKIKPPFLFRKFRPEGVPPEKADLAMYRSFRKRQAKEQKDVNQFLRKLKPKGIDPNRTLRKQKFRKIDWTEGDNIKDVFTRIQHKRMRAEDEKP